MIQFGTFGDCDVAIRVDGESATGVINRPGRVSLVSSVKETVPTTVPADAFSLTVWPVSLEVQRASLVSATPMRKVASMSLPALFCADDFDRNNGLGLVIERDAVT